MPELVLTVRELQHRHGEIPSQDDCFLVDMWGDGHEQGEVPSNHEGMITQFPVLHTAVDPLVNARDYADPDPEDEDDDEWLYQYGADRFRFGCNTPSLYHPVYLKFQWGDGVPPVDGIPVLMHKGAKVHAGYTSEWCDECGYKMYGLVEDCPTLRLQALAAAVAAGEPTQVHLDAVARWHKGNRWAAAQARSRG